MKLALPLIFGLILALTVVAQEDDKVLDDNTAFFEGNTQSYIISPPADFKMVIFEAVADGYSCAFIPSDEPYDSASVIIGVNLFRVMDEFKDSFEISHLIENDTTVMRGLYGPTLTIHRVDSLMNGSNQTVTTFFLNDTSTFIPNVMISYYDGGSEVLTFDLAITETIPRFIAEDIYVACLGRFKVLPKGTLEGQQEN